MRDENMGIRLSVLTSWIHGVMEVRHEHVGEDGSETSKVIFAMCIIVNKKKQFTNNYLKQECSRIWFYKPSNAELN